MKRCPTCNRTYTDPNLSFCIDDGTPLVKDEAYDPEATLVSPSPSGGKREATPTSAAGQGIAPSDWKGPVYQPPGSVGQAPRASQGKAWPWIVGILALLLIAVVCLGVAAAIFVPRMMRAAVNRNENSGNANVEKRESNRNSNTDSDANSNSDSASANLNENENRNLNANSADNNQPPTDEDEVLSALTDLENEWTVANINADKKALTRILADDYVGKHTDGSMEGKADYLRTIKPDKTIKHWDFEDLKLTLRGERATLNGKLSLEIEGQTENVVYNFTDKFVWRDGRWQAVWSEVSRLR
jgi:hypothetical protein